MSDTPQKHEPEHKGPLWKHPYMVYIALTGVLFIGLVVAAGLALTHGWLPTR